jgi:L-aspartate oxidase
MGGVATDSWGSTSLAGLFAAGECAGTGAHGANRLASNSLLEAAVFGRRAGLAAANLATARTSPARAEAPAELPAAELQVLRNAMSDDAGVARDAAGLGRLLDRISAMDARHGRALPLVTARMVCEAALDRRESRGAHFRTDFPASSAAAVHTSRTLDIGSARRQRAA